MRLQEEWAMKYFYFNCFSLLLLPLLMSCSTSIYQSREYQVVVGQEYALSRDAFVIDDRRNGRGLPSLAYGFSPSQQRRGSYYKIPETVAHEEYKKYNILLKIPRGAIVRIEGIEINKQYSFWYGLISREEIFGKMEEGYDRNEKNNNTLLLCFELNDILKINNWGSLVTADKGDKDTTTESSSY